MTNEEILTIINKAGLSLMSGELIKARDKLEEAINMINDRFL